MFYLNKKAYLLTYHLVLASKCHNVFHLVHIKKYCVACFFMCFLVVARDSTISEPFGFGSGVSHGEVVSDLMLFCYLFTLSWTVYVATLKAI